MERMSPKEGSDCVGEWKAQLNIRGSPALAAGRAAIRLLLKCLFDRKLHEEVTTWHYRSVSRDELLGSDGAHLMLALRKL